MLTSLNQLSVLGPLIEKSMVLHIKQINYGGRQMKIICRILVDAFIHCQ